MTAQEKKKQKLADQFRLVANMLAEMPLNIPIEFRYNEGSPVKDYSVVGAVTNVNDQSARINLLAVDHKGFPWPTPDKMRTGNNARPNMHKVTYSHIVSWRVVKPEDLPTYIGHQTIYPGLQKELAKGGIR